MTKTVRSYWSGALHRLQAEVQSFSKLVEHEAEKGRENELVLARVLSSLIPQRFGTGSGLLIDSNDKQSRQIDVIIFEQAMEAALFAQTTQLLYPVETVYAAIEVKTTLRADDIVQYGESVRRTAELTSKRAHRDGNFHPVNCLFAYSAWAMPETVAAHLLALPSTCRPDVFCVVDQGFVGGKPSTFDSSSGESGDFVMGITFLQDANDLPIVVDKPTDNVRGETAHRTLRITKGQYGLVDPARALLLFLDSLLGELHRKSDGGESVLSLYLDEGLRALRAVQPGA